MGGRNSRGTNNFFLFLGAGFLLAFSFVFIALATSEKDIVFPVVELGNCKNKQECKAYCAKQENINACISFAKKHNLMSEKEVKRAEAVAELPPGGGPGGCATLQECANYCGDVDHIRECLAFGREHGLMEQHELEEAEKVEKALRGGATLPGGCTSKDECEAYCHEEGHMDECIEFGRAAGFMTEEEYQIAKRTGGRGPGGCRGRECQDYCEDENHFEECLAFGREHGLISNEEYEVARKTGGRGPGGCRRDECRDYCESPDHFEECLAFGREHGLISDEEYEIARKTGGQGPGGCRGEECKRYCEDGAHQEECVAFAKEHGLISEEEVGRIEEHRGRLRNILNEAPPEVIVCLRETLGTNLVEEMRNGEIQPGPEIGEKVRACFEQIQRREAPPGEGNVPPGVEYPEEHEAFEEPAEHEEPENFSGPGGCKTPEECRAYCSDPAHARECGFPEPVPPVEVQPVPLTQPEARLRLFGAILLQALQIILGR